MKMNSTQIEQTLTQFEAEAIPADHPVVPQLTRIFGDHTYFLDSVGLNIVEPVENEQEESPVGVVVNVATWVDAATASLQPHEPEPTELTVALEPRTSH